MQTTSANLELLDTAGRSPIAFLTFPFGHIAGERFIIKAVSSGQYLYDLKAVYDSSVSDRKAELERVFDAIACLTPSPKLYLFGDWEKELDMSNPEHHFLAIVMLNWKKKGGETIIVSLVGTEWEDWLSEEFTKERSPEEKKGFLEVLLQVLPPGYSRWRVRVTLKELCDEGEVARGVKQC